MATTDPILTKINHETDLRFWAAHPDKNGQKLAAGDPLVQAWLSINYQVKQDVSNGSIHWSGDPAPAAVLDPSTHPADQATPHPAANVEIQMPDDYVGHGDAHQPPGGVTSPAQVATVAPAEIQMPDDYVGKAPAPVSTPPHKTATGGHSHAAHPTAPATRPAIDAATQAKLYAETNARFWAQTGYRPGQKLDASNPADRAMMPVWTDAYKKVEAQYRAGTLQPTYDHPQVVAGITDAAHHAADAAASANAAVKAAVVDGDHAAAAAHLADASASHHHATTAGASAAAVQPPTVSPELAHKARHQVQDFVMNGGTGIPTGPAHEDGDNIVAAMQAASAPAQAQAGASSAPASQTAPADQNGAADAIPTFPPSSADHDGKHGLKDRGRLAMGLGIGASVLAAAGLVAFAVRGRHSTRGTVRRSPPHRYALARR